MWSLVHCPHSASIKVTKWVFKNKTNEDGIIITCNKARLVAQEYIQIEGVDFDERFAPVA